MPHRGEKEVNLVADVGHRCVLKMKLPGVQNPSFHPTRGRVGFHPAEEVDLDFTDVILVIPRKVYGMGGDEFKHMHFEVEKKPREAQNPTLLRTSRSLRGRGGKTQCDPPTSSGLVPEMG